MNPVQPSSCSAKRRAGLAVVVVLGMLGDVRGDFYVDFRGKPLSDKFLVTGTEANSRIASEPEGLRITLPAEQTRPGPVGIVAAFEIKGDFEITTNYELLQADRPATGFGVGFEVYIFTKTTSKEALSFFHLVRKNGTMAYACSRLSTNAEGRRSGLPGLRLDDQPAMSKAGKLRIVRVGTEAVLSAAAQGEQEFHERYRFELGNEDVAMLRLAANPGNAANPLDLRIHDLRVRALGVPDQAEEQPIGEPVPRRTALWLATGMLCLALVLGGLFFWVRRSRREEHGAPDE